MARKKQQKNGQAPRIWAPKRSPTCGEMILRSSAGPECLQTRVCSKHVFGLLFWGYFYLNLFFVDMMIIKFIDLSFIERWSIFGWSLKRRLRLKKMKF